MKITPETVTPRTPLTRADLRRLGFTRQDVEALFDRSDLKTITLGRRTKTTLAWIGELEERLTEEREPPTPRITSGKSKSSAKGGMTQGENIRLMFPELYGGS